MTNNNDTAPPECAPQTIDEEGGFVDEAIPTTSLDRPKVKSRLSTISKMYDIDGDGELDEAELAMRNLDSSGRGFLTNEKVYKLMEEQLKLQKDVFQMKKVIVGLLVFVAILALSNLGTSFASAILAKDTTTNSSNELVNKKTGETLATDQAVTKFKIEEEESRRSLQGEKVYGVTSDSPDHLTAADALQLLDFCESGNKVVKLTYDNGNGLAERTVCGTDWNCGPTFVMGTSPVKPISGVLCLQGSVPAEKVSIQADPNDSELYTVTPIVEATVVVDPEPIIAVVDPVVVGEEAPMIISGGQQAPEELATCASNEECAANRDGKDFCNNEVCGYCELGTNGNDAERPRCIDQGNGIAVWGCDDSSCASGTCGSPWCVPGITNYCSANHNLDYGC